MSQSNLISRAANLVLDNHKPVIAVSFIVFLGFMAFMPKLQMGQLRTEEQLRAHDPARLKYKQFVAEFGNDLDLLIAYEAKGGLFTVENLQRLKDLTADLEQLPAVYRVTSLANSNYQWVNEDEFNSRLFLDPDFFPTNEEEAAALKAQALAYEPFQKALISDDGNTTILVVRPKAVDGEKDNMTLAFESYNQVEKLIEEKYGDLNVRMLGEAVGVMAFMKLLIPEAILLAVVSIVVMTLLLVFCFRNVWGVLAPGLITVMTITMTVATFAMLGHRFGDVSLMVTIILLAISLADSIHMFATYQEKYRELQNKRQALYETYCHVFVPCLFTTVSTAIGFISLSIAHNMSIVYLALHAFLGTWIAWALTFFLMPALLLILPPPAGLQRERSKALTKVLNWVTSANQHHGGKLALFFTVIFAVMVFGITKLRFDQNNFRNLPEDHPVIADTRYLEEHIGIGTTTLQLLVKGEPESLKSPQAQHALDELLGFIRQQELVFKAQGIPDMLKAMNQLINLNDPGKHVIPDDEDTFGRLYYMLANSEGLSSILSFDNGATVINISLAQTEFSKYDKLIASIEKWIAEHPSWPKGLSVSQDGVLAMTSAQYHSIMTDQINGFSLAFVLIFAMFVIMFRSLRVGFIAILPNIIPIAFVLGFMGWFDIYMSTTMLVVANIAIGLAVDDTIHMMYNYKVFKSQGLSHDDCVNKTIDVTGGAVMFTTFVLVGSILSFLLSGMPVMREIGVLLAMPLAVALFADLLFLPEMLKLLLGKAFNRDTAHS